jgi:TPR repeat protein
VKSSALLFLLLSLLFVSAPAAAAPLDDGQSAYARGDYPTALSLLRPLADQGNAQAQFRLGWMYWHGNGVKPDIAGALQWYRKAAEQGDTRAELSLAAIYWWGMGGVAKDYAETFKWYRRAADQGDAVAQLSLGKMYEHGAGVQQDLVQAYVWISLSKAVNKYSAQSLDRIAAKMTPEQVDQAKRQAAAWRPSPAPKP